jgi:16S rRNA processing protein RimM
MADAAEIIRVGVVGRAHGVRGAIRVFMDEPQSDSLLRVKKVYIGETWTAFNVLHATRCGRFVALELEGIDDRDKAFGLTGLPVGIDRGALRPLKGAFYACDLVGLLLVDETGKQWGRVHDIVPGAAHDLLHYSRTDGGFGIVPFVSAHVGKVDTTAGTVEVDGAWMEELDRVYEEGH